MSRQDDFAAVLMEDAEGEVLSLTDETPASGDFKAWAFGFFASELCGAMTHDSCCFETKGEKNLTSQNDGLLS